MEMINHCTSEGKPTTSSQVFNRATNRAICFRASKGTWAHLKKLALGRGRNPLFPYGHPWAHLGLAMAKAGWNRDGSTWTQVWSLLLAAWVEVQDRQRHSAELPFCKGKDTHTNSRNLSPPSGTAPAGDSSPRDKKLKTEIKAISDFAKLGQDCRARYFLTSHRNSRTRVANTALWKRYKQLWQCCGRFFAVLLGFFLSVSLYDFQPHFLESSLE